MRKLLQPVRFVGMLSTLLFYIVVMSIVWTIVRDRWARLKWSNRILTLFARFSVRLLNLHPRYIGETNGESGVLFVGNHLSYLDIIVIHSRVPACFVTSTEIRETPVLGQICQLAGCLFVERRRRANLRGEVNEIADALGRGFNVAIFPEATSTNGERILKFKRPLFTAAERAARPVVPFCLNYHAVGGRPIDVSTRDKVFWYGDMGFAGHLWSLCGSGGVEVDLTFLNPRWPSADVDASALAEQAQGAVEGVFRPIRP